MPVLQIDYPRMQGDTASSVSPGMRCLLRCFDCQRLWRVLSPLRLVEWQQRKRLLAWPLDANHSAPIIACLIDDGRDLRRPTYLRRICGTGCNRGRRGASSRVSTSRIHSIRDGRDAVDSDALLVAVNCVAVGFQVQDIGRYNERASSPA